jgi:hypothetical protein
VPYKNKADRNARARERRLNPDIAPEIRKAEAAAKRKWRAADPERHYATYRDWYHNGGGKEIVAAYKIKYYNPTRAQSRNLKRAYTLTLEAYEAMVVAQDGKCAICKSDNGDTNHKKKLFVDHDHQTGKVRALLCHRCNSGIGYMRDDVNLLRAAIAYLEEHSACPA